MEPYRAVWLRVARFATVAGVCTAFAVFPLLGLSITFTLSALVGSMSAWTWKGCRDGRRLALVGFVSGSAVLATCAITALLGTAGLALPALLAGSAPPLVTWLARRTHQWNWQDYLPTTAPNAECGSASEFEPVETCSPGRTLAYQEWMTHSPAALDPSALCLAWRRSYLTLRQPLSLASRLLVVKRRQELLDELERRNPSGFTAWLDSGARAAGDPRRYIVSGGGEEPTADQVQ
jgi:hypothetical protein